MKLHDLKAIAKHARQHGLDAYVIKGGVMVRGLEHACALVKIHPSPCYNTLIVIKVDAGYDYITHVRLAQERMAGAFGYWD